MQCCCKGDTRNFILLLHRWLLIGMEKAGINTDKYKAHSTRAAASSSMKRSGMSINQILAKAHWSSKSNTFAKFYDRA